MALRDELSAPGLKRSRWTRFRAGVARRFGWLWKPQLYAGVTLAFLLGRALPGTQVAPLGLAFYAAVRGTGFGATAALPVGLAAVAGAWLALPALPALWVGLGVLFCHLACSLFRVGARGPTPLGAAVVASVSILLPTTLAAGLPPLVSLGFWTGLTGVLALVFTLGIVDVTTGRVLQIGAADSPVPAIVILAAALCGLDGLTLGGWVSLRDTVAALMVMTCAYAGGPPLGAAAGGLLGIGFLFTMFGSGPGPAGVTLGIAGPQPESRAVAYVIAGLLAGTFRELRKAGVGIAFALGLITYAMFMIHAPADLKVLSVSAGVGVLLFWLTPRSWLASIPAALVTTADSPREVREPRSFEPAVLAERLRGISRVLREVSRTFDQVSVEENAGEPGPGRVFEQVAERVCHSCSMYQQCWGADFHKTYQVYTDMWQQINDEGPLPTQPIPEELGQHCIKPDRVATTLNYLYDLEQSRHHWERRLEEGRGVVRDYLKNVTRMFDRFVDEIVSSDGRDRIEREAVIRVQSGVARLPKRGGQISGDSYVGAPLGRDRYLLALSDGMGVGRGAALESKQCVRLLQEILEAGFSTDVALNTVNSALLLRSPEETFATVDLSLLDLTTGRAEFVKVGAAPSFVKRGGEVTVVKMSSAPIGIINQLEVEPEFRVLRPGDIIVMMTDGIWDVCKDNIDKERWLIDQLSREPAADPEEIAESILARAVELSPDAGDDMTVLVARIDRVAGAGAETRAPAGEGWAPVRMAPRLSPKKPAAEKAKK
jgi:stage II sporulation protein E